MFRLFSQMLAKKTARETVDRCLTLLTHELRHSLTIIGTSAELLQQGGDRLAPEKQEQYWQRIQNNIQNLDALLHTIYIATEQSLQQYPMQPEWIDVADFCRGLAAEVQLETEQHRIQFTCGSEPSRNDRNPQPIFAYLDPQMLKIILLNLLNNSIKYTPQGGEINFNLTAFTDQVIFSVRDPGIGIPPRERSRLFLPFYRGSNTQTIPGTGIGLFLVQQLVKAQSGQIMIASNPNGTTCTVHLPRQNQA
jgi:signal transduction histidine kinase